MSFVLVQTNTKFILLPLQCHLTANTSTGSDSNEERNSMWVNDYARSTCTTRDFL